MSSARAVRGQPYQVKETSNHPYQQHEPAPLFITSFVRECFTEDLCEVDFTQAITAMDYLRIFEEKRKRELAAAFRRLNVDPAPRESERQVLENSHPGIFGWISSTEAKSKKVEALYTQVFIGLRRWTLINEMRLEPFNKPNCIAMLNTLYAPSYGSQPTIQLTENVLNAQRNAFFRYIQAVEKNGKDVLTNLENASRRQGDVNGWPVVRDIVDVYLRKANGLMEDCQAVKGTEDFEAVSKDKRTDSGVSFGSDVERKPVLEKRPTLDKRPSTSMGSSATSSISDKSSGPMQPGCGERKPSIGTFERIARELRRIKSRSADSKDPKDSGEGFAKKPSMGSPRPPLRKMRSTSAINQEIPKKEGKHSRDNSNDRSGATPSQYTIDDAQRERLIREAQQHKESLKPRLNASPSQFAGLRPKAIKAQTARERGQILLREEVSSPTSCRINRLDAKDPYRLPELMLPELAA